MDTKREQFSLIYDQYIEKIYRFVYLKVNSQESAEDITSRVFTKAWEVYNGSATPIASMSGFLYQVSRNMVIDHYRGRGRATTVSLDDVPMMADIRTNVHEKAVLSQDIEQVKNALQNIKKDYQDVLIWHYLEDMSTAEVAAILGKSEGAVRVMVHRGLSALKDQMSQLS